MILRQADHCSIVMSHCLTVSIQDYDVSDYEETTYDYELERPALDLDDDAEDTLEVSDGGGCGIGRGVVLVQRHHTD